MEIWNESRSGISQRIDAAAGQATAGRDSRARTGQQERSPWGPRRETTY